MSFIGILIIVAVILVLVVIVLDKYHEKYSVEYADEIFHKQYGSIIYKQKMLHDYAKRHGYIEPVKKIIAPAYKRYSKDIWSKANQEQLRVAYIKALKYMEELFEKKDWETINSGSLKDLETMVNDCYGGEVFEI